MHFKLLFLFKVISLHRIKAMIGAQYNGIFTSFVFKTIRTVR